MDSIDSRVLTTSILVLLGGWKNRKIWTQYKKNCGNIIILNKWIVNWIECPSTILFDKYFLLWLGYNINLTFPPLKSDIYFAMRLLCFLIWSIPPVPSSAPSLANCTRRHAWWVSVIISIPILSKVHNSIWYLIIYYIITY